MFERSFDNAQCLCQLALDYFSVSNCVFRSIVWVSATFFDRILYAPWVYKLLSQTRYDNAAKNQQLSRKVITVLKIDRFVTR